MGGRRQRQLRAGGPGGSGVIRPQRAEVSRGWPGGVPAAAGQYPQPRVSGRTRHLTARAVHPGVVPLGRAALQGTD
jgi:hypothetical protein